MTGKHTRGRGKGKGRRGSRMLGGYSNGMLVGAPITGGQTSGQMYGAQAVTTLGGNGDMVPTDHGGIGLSHRQSGGQSGGAYQMIVPAALVLANNVIGRGRSLRYKGKGGLARGSSRRRKGSRRR